MFYLNSYMLNYLIHFSMLEKDESDSRKISQIKQAVTQEIFHE